MHHGARRSIGIAVLSLAVTAIMAGPAIGAFKTIEGNNQPNNLSGTGGRDRILGKGAGDTLNGYGAKDLVVGGTGDDRVGGGAAGGGSMDPDAGGPSPFAT